MQQIAAVPKNVAEGSGEAATFGVVISFLPHNDPSLIPERCMTVTSIVRPNEPS
jgi:hypothetical protein